ncbi:unnamed protein product [Vitrella brassicaformis CCMP3155]|uniref:Protein kinase domain-containing protein n=1 Tax=Vitrella brassicaformis (strain CCMP3155) TaxID=1169540 RepID=A0A0G4F4W9_VITBC|nr:unnamed protein product [Vitrella brassicaformis CCMP3155]|eukprot:CEM06980.1 unnamed protein product [Vitrella brassicaformis CCMP3155]
MRRGSVQIDSIRLHELYWDDEVDCIGDGAFAEVYKGQWRDQTVALKIPKKHLINSLGKENLVKEVEAEAKFVAGMKHPNVAKLLGVCYDKRIPFLVLEFYVDSLRKCLSILQRRGGLPENKRYMLARQLCEGLAYIHSKGGIHRDIKPENVLLDDDQNVKISDFGLSRELQGTHHSSSHFGGTVVYAPPEAFADRPQLTDRSDIWSVGCIIAEYSAIEQTICENKETPPIPPKIPVNVKQAIQSCFAFNPRSRPSAHELLNKLNDRGRTVTPDPRVSPTPAPAPAPQPQIKHADIFDAVKAGDLQSVRLFIARDGKDILDKRDNAGDTPFLEDALYGHVGVMSLMYETKPDVLQQTNKSGRNALHWAAREGHVAAVNKLMEWDPKLIDARDENGYTPFISAAYGGHVDVLKALYAKRKDLLTQKDDRGETALHLAAICGNSAAVSQLLEWGGGALLDIKRKDGKTPWDNAPWSESEMREIMKKYKR